MPRRKCVICNQWIESVEDSIPFKNRYAHTKCFNISMKLLSDNKTKKLEDNKKEKNFSGKKIKEVNGALSEEEFQQKQQYFDFIKEVSGGRNISAKVYKLTQDYISQYGFSYLGMFQALWYFVHIQERELTGDIVGILPYIYEEAQTYFSLAENTEKKNAAIQAVDPLYQPRTVYLKPNIANNHQIDIATIGENERVFL